MINNIFHNCAYSYSHGVDKTHMGLFYLYYSLVYTNKAKICVVLGSGGGIVPMAFAEAQRDLGYGITYLIDGYGLENVSTTFGTPIEDGGWALENSIMFDNYPEICVHNALTSEYGKHFNKIDVLHIDAEHTYDAVLQDFSYYQHALIDTSIITFHDTQDDGIQQAVCEIAEEYNFEALHLRDMASGLSILRKSHKDGYESNLYDDCKTRPESHTWTLGPEKGPKTWGSK